MRKEEAMSATPDVPYTMLVQQFRAAPPGKLYCLHGSKDVFRLSLTAAAHVLLGGVPMTLVDGTNRFDLYYLAEFARRFAVQQKHDAGTRSIDPEQLLRNIYIARAFTCYQMEATITERLPAFVRKKGSPVAIIFGLLDTFYDDQAPLFEVKASLQRIITALQRLKEERVSVLLASMDVRPASTERNALLPRLLAIMDRTYSVEELEGQCRIVQQRTLIGAGRGIIPVPRLVSGERAQGESYGKNGPDIYHGAPAGGRKLGKIPAGAPQRGSGNVR